MKRLLTTLLIGLCAIFLFTNIASAVVYTFQDNYVSWPGMENATYPNDMIGTPDVRDMTVSVSEAGLLESVVINVFNRRVFDSLFINTDYTGNNPDNTLSTDYDSWNYFVMDSSNPDSNYPNAINPIATGLYEVSDPYAYTNSVEGRIGHANGIAAQSLTGWQNIAIGYDGTYLTYNFLGLGVDVGSEFVIGYTPWCANDVTIGSPVPEPATMVLFGFGLLGLAGISRRKVS